MQELSLSDGQVVQRFLESVAEAAERHADRLAAEADTAARDVLAVASPALWA